jgi:hypothetical protein
MKWVVHIARMEGVRNAYKIPSGNLNMRYDSEYLGAHGRIIME